MINFLIKTSTAIVLLIMANCLYIHAQETVKQPKVLDELLQTDSKDRLIFEVAHANWSNRPAGAQLGIQEQLIFI